MIRTSIENGKNILHTLKADEDARHQLLAWILGKCIDQTESAFIKEKISLIELCVVTRYNLEALMNVKLCSQNEANTWAFLFRKYFGIKDQKEIQIEQIKNENEVLKKYAALDSEETKLYSKEKDAQAHYRREHELNEKFKAEPVYLSISAIENGFQFIHDRNLSTVIPKFSEQIKGMNKNILELSKKVKSDIGHQLAFKIKEIEQPSSVQKKINVEVVDWEARAKETGLQNEYDFIYSYTSSIIHCVGYSFVTNPEIDEMEKIILERASARYLNEMSELIRQISTDEIRIIKI